MRLPVEPAVQTEVLRTGPQALLLFYDVWRIYVGRRVKFRNAHLEYACALTASEDFMRYRGSHVSASRGAPRLGAASPLETDCCCQLPDAHHA
jgi:hypothetical protein